MKMAEIRKLLGEHADEVLGREPEKHETLPALNPTLWQKVYCRCGSCELCRWFATVELDASVKPWTDKRPPRMHDRPRWPSVTAALERYVQVHAEGYAVRSSSGVVSDVLEIGGMVQTSGKPRPPRAIEDAEDVAEIDKALQLAFDHSNDRGIGPDACRQVLLMRVVGATVAKKDRSGRPYRAQEPVPADALAERYTVTRETVAGIVKSGRRRVRIELAARGLIQQPKPNAGLDEAIAKRMEELGAL